MRMCDIAYYVRCPRINDCIFEVVVIVVRVDIPQSTACAQVVWKIYGPHIVSKFVDLFGRLWQFYVHLAYILQEILANSMITFA